MYLLYNVVTLLAAVVLAPWFAAQALRHGKYLGSLRARLGQQPPPADTRRSIWIQAVSVGEVMAARPLVAELKRRYPGLRLVVSTTTRTGQEVAARLLTEADAVIYFPLDWPFAVGGVLTVLAALLALTIKRLPREPAGRPDVIGHRADGGPA